ncbi:lipocalin family protein [Algoriphagus boritolerans]|uniref:lipocalin family protein n=1 Tax=Algoriphagus boritolerans TaxID=308111 RepID=UPI000AB8E5E1
MNLTHLVMKKYLLLLFLFLTGWVSGQSLEGSWKLVSQNGNAVSDQEYIKIYQDDYFAFGVKNVADNAFIGAGGGPFKFENGKYSETLDFFTLNPLQVGTTTPFKIELDGSKLILSANTNNGMLVEIWEKISDARDDLTGNWVITGRKRDDQVSRSTPGARRTVKILSGGRFQWIAFNSETREFSGTGGEPIQRWMESIPKISPSFPVTIPGSVQNWDLTLR